ncbi:MAG: dissimilatory-type sulfite reductase subunit alpha [Candidatus Electryonea clarkiae]|nr:dissimilatory-type sulfite reductase subunit alpha [Candidatus Electryonea clarkiae]MDP8287818.1 dissimilatory-type sulfite reductase subunit alpha [Candidatus Electryonea clarkiae]
MPKEYKTPMLDELEKGPWPSFVKEIKLAAKKNVMSNDLLGLLERSYNERLGHWKHGGIVGVFGYGGGVIGRYTDLPEEYPEISHFHTLRINQPSGWFYTTEALRTLCDIWDRHGSGLTNMHGSTGDIIFLGTKTDELEPIFKELTEAGFDLGGSGSDMRTPSCCVGPGRCEWACYDTLQRCYDITMKYQDELHRPAFPYKWKFKFSGCPNDCVAAIARADISIIGTWKDDIKMDQAEVKKYAENGVDIFNDVVLNCPAKCMKYDGDKLEINNNDCRRCMHCINVMPKALRPGDDKGAIVLIGAKAPIVEGALLSSVLIPFLNIDDDEEFEDFCDLVEEMQDVWCEEGKNRERVGEFIQRVGMGNFLEAVGVEPIPEMIAYPRDNPYIFFEMDEDEEEEEE